MAVSGKELLSLSIVFLCLGFFFHRQQENEIYAHLAVGRSLSNNFDFHSEPLARTGSSGSWHDPLWASEFACFWFCRLAGHESRIWLLPPLLYAFLLACCLRNFPSPVFSIAATVCFLIAAYPCHRASLECTAHFCALLFALALVRFQNRPFSWFLLLASQILWTNCHPSFLLGPLTAFLYFSGQRRSFRFLLSALACLFSACLVSPYFLESLMRAPRCWAAMNSPGEAFWPFFWLLASLAFFLHWKRGERNSAGECFVLLGWCALTLFRPSWAVPSSLWAIRMISHADSQALDSWERKFSVRAVIVSAALCLAFVSLSGWDERWCGKRGSGAREDLCPVRAAAFLQDVPFPARIGHPRKWGGYLAWQTGWKTLFDSRPLIHPESLVREWESPDEFPSLLQRYDLNIAVLEHSSVANEEVLRRFASKLDWRPVYCDHLAAVFVRSQIDSHAFIDRFEISDDRTPMPPPVESGDRKALAEALYRRSRAMWIMGFPLRALADTEEARKLRPLGPKLSSLFLDLCLQINTRESLDQGREWCLNAGDTSDREKYLGQIESADATLLEWSGDTAGAAERLLLAWNHRNEPGTLCRLIELHMRMGDAESLAKAEKWCIEAGEWLGFAKTLRYRAEIAHRRGEPERAAAFLDTLLSQSPGNPELEGYLRELKEEIRGEEIEQTLDHAKKLAQEGKERQALHVLEELTKGFDSFAEAHLEMGRILFSLQSHSEAASHFRRVLQIAPGDARASAHLAKSLAHLGKWQEALEILDPLEKGTHQDRYDVRQAIGEVLETAVEELKKSLREIPDRPFLGLQLARLLARQEKYGEGIEVLETHKNSIPAPSRHEYTELLGDLYHESGRSLLNQGKVEDGIEALRRSLHCRPEHFPSHLLLGVIALKLKDWAEAERHFGAVHAAAPQDGRGQYGLALIELGKGLMSQAGGDYEQALSRFEKYTSIVPDESEKKRMESILGNIRENREDLQRDWQNKKAELCLSGGVKMSEQKKWEAAVRLLRMALQIRPEWNEARSELHFALGMRAMEEERWDTAAAELERAVSFRAKFGEALSNLGLAYVRQHRISLERNLASDAEKQIQAAERALLEALAIRPELSRARYLLARDVYYQNGQYEKAKLEFDAFLAQEPQGEWADRARRHLATISLLQGGEPINSEDRR